MLAVIHSKVIAACVCCPGSSTTIYAQSAIGDGRSVPDAKQKNTAASTRKLHTMSVTGVATANVKSTTIRTSRIAIVALK